MKKRAELNEVEYVKYVKVAETYAGNNAEEPQTNVIKPECKPELTPRENTGTVIGNESCAGVFADSAVSVVDDSASVLA